MTSLKNQIASPLLSLVLAAGCGAPEIEDARVIGRTAYALDTSSPTVSLTTPGAGSIVSGLVTVSANAADNVGVTRVDFFDGSKLIGSDTSAPYSVSWSSITIPKEHSLTAKAYDAAGNVGVSAPIAVSVKPVTISFSGFTWCKKNARYAPADNIFKNDNVWVDGQGLHLRMSPPQAGDDGIWSSAEVYLCDGESGAEVSLGYGLYTLREKGVVNSVPLDRNAVFSMFLYANDQAEIDMIEMSRWRDPAEPLGHYVVHGSSGSPQSSWELPGDLSGGDHNLLWDAGSADFWSSPGASWGHYGANVPEASQGLVPRINLWLARKNLAGEYDVNGPYSNQPIEIIIESISFTPTLPPCTSGCDFT